jgi:Domain of unknown function (DUF4124)
MKRAMILPLLIICSAAAANGGTYKWTDDQGVVSFTDDPSLIPSRYHKKAVKVQDVPSRDPKVLQELREEVDKPRQDKSTPSRSVTTADSERAMTSVPVRQQEIKGHLGGDQADPTPPSMKQPLPLPLGDQPKNTPAGMEQPKPIPLGDQPKPMPAGMEQPKPIPLGDQPKEMPAGMEQPTPMK